MEIKMIASWVFALGLPAWLVVEEIIRRYGAAPSIKRAAPERVRKPRRSGMAEPNAA